MVRTRFALFAAVFCALILSDFAQAEIFGSTTPPPAIVPPLSNTIQSGLNRNPATGLSPADYRSMSCPLNSNVIAQFAQPEPNDPENFQRWWTGANCACDYTDGLNRNVRGTQKFSYSREYCVARGTNVSAIEAGVAVNRCRSLFASRFGATTTWQVTSCRVVDQRVSLVAPLCDDADRTNVVNRLYQPSTTVPTPPNLSGFDNQLAMVSTSCTCSYQRRTPWIGGLFRNVSETSNTGLMATVCQRTGTNSSALYKFGPAYCQEYCNALPTTNPTIFGPITATSSPASVQYPGVPCATSIGTASISVTGPGKVVAGSKVNCPGGSCSISYCVYNNISDLPDLTAIPNSGAGIARYSSAHWLTQESLPNLSAVDFTVRQPAATGGANSFVFTADLKEFTLKGSPQAVLGIRPTGVLGLTKPEGQLSASAAVATSELRSIASVEVIVMHRQGVTTTVTPPSWSACRLIARTTTQDRYSCTASAGVVQRQNIFTVAVDEQTEPKVEIKLEGNGTGRVDGPTDDACVKNGTAPVTCNMILDELFVAPSDDSYVSHYEAVGGSIGYEYHARWIGSQHITPNSDAPVMTIIVHFAKRPTSVAEAGAHDLIIKLVGSGSGRMTATAPVDYIAGLTGEGSHVYGSLVCLKPTSAEVTCILPGFFAVPMPDGPIGGDFGGGDPFGGGGSPIFNNPIEKKHMRLSANAEAPAQVVSVKIGPSDCTWIVDQNPFKPIPAAEASGVAEAPNYCQKTPTIEVTFEPPPTPTPTPSPTVKPSPSPSPSPSVSSSPIPTATPVPTVKPSATPVPTATPKPSPSPSPSPVSTSGPIFTSIPTTSIAPAPTVKPSSTPVPTATPKPSPSPSPSPVSTTGPIFTSIPTTSIAPAPTTAPSGSGWDAILRWAN